MDILDEEYKNIVKFLLINPMYIQISCGTEKINLVS